MTRVYVREPMSWLARPAPKEAGVCAMETGIWSVDVGAEYLTAPTMYGVGMPGKCLATAHCDISLND